MAKVNVPNPRDGDSYLRSYEYWIFSKRQARMIEWGFKVNLRPFD